jgi:hypothetical protein
MKDFVVCNKKYFSSGVLLFGMLHCQSIAAYSLDWPAPRSPSLR